MTTVEKRIVPPFVADDSKPDMVIVPFWTGTGDSGKSPDFTRRFSAIYDREDRTETPLSQHCGLIIPMSPSEIEHDPEGYKMLMSPDVKYPEVFHDLCSDVWSQSLDTPEEKARNKELLGKLFTVACEYKDMLDVKKEPTDEYLLSVLVEATKKHYGDLSSNDIDGISEALGIDEEDEENLSDNDTPEEEGFVHGSMMKLTGSDTFHSRVLIDDKEDSPPKVADEKSMTIDTILFQLEEMSIPEKKMAIIRKIFNDREPSMNSIVKEYFIKHPLIDVILETIETEAAIRIKNHRGLQTAFSELAAIPKMTESVKKLEKWVYRKDIDYNPMDILEFSVNAIDVMNLKLKKMESICYYPARHSASDLIEAVVTYINEVYNIDGELDEDE